MYKQFLLLFIIIINVSIYSQVVIKDEIILYETENPDEENLTMPFYGNAFIRFIAPGQKMRAYFTVDGQTKFLNEISGATYNCSCGLPLWSMDVQWTFSNVPAARDVELLAVQCQQVSPTPPPSGTCDWVELPVEFNEDTQTEDKWNLSVDVNYPNTPPDWRYSGYILFTSTTPPLCCPTERSCIDECDQPFNLPSLDIDSIPNAEVCIDTADTAAAVFKGLYWELREGEELTLTPCQDPMTGEVKFKYATNLGDSINLPYNLELCPDNIAYLNLRRIDDLDEFEEYLLEKFPIGQTPDPDTLCTLRQAILRHQGIDANGNQTGGEIFFAGWIWLTEHSLTHELEHKRDYINTITDSIEIFYDYYNTYSVPCSTFVEDSVLANSKARDEYLKKLFEFSDQAKIKYDTELNEVEVNGRQIVLDSIKPYLNILDKLIRNRFYNDIQTALFIINNCPPRR